jgi:UDP-N-acetylmuramate dehydrogenase
MGDLTVALDRLGDVAERDVPIGPLTTYRVGGPAAALVRAESPADLQLVADAIAGTRLPVLVLGKGSNVLVHDDGFAGVVVMLGAGFAEVEIDDTRVRVGAAASLPVVARRTAAAGLTGFEWAVGVPGSMGGAVRMNAGGHGSDMAASLVSADVVDLCGGGLSTRSADDLDLAYRSSSIAGTDVVVAAELELRPGDATVAEAEIAEIVRWRREHQPGGHNAGSVFVNPPGDSAGRLIDAAGRKGTRVGTAEVSTKHANFIQADDGGSAADVYDLMATIIDEVAAETGITLLVETRLIGFPAIEPRATPRAPHASDASSGQGDDQP